MSNTSAPMTLIEQGIRELTESNAFLREELNRVQAMFQVEDRGWMKLFGGLGEDDVPGLSLDQLKKWSEEIQEYIQQLQADDAR